MGLVSTFEEFEKALQALQTAPILAVDTETNKTDRLNERYMMGVSFAYYDQNGLMQSVYMPFRHKHDTRLFPGDNLPVSLIPSLRSVLSDPDKTFIYHNAPFDQIVFRKEEIETPGFFWDTQLMSHMVNENPWMNGVRHDHALKDLGQILLDDNSNVEQKQLAKVEKAVGGWEKIPPIAMAPYAEKDTVLTYRLWKHFKVELQKQQLTHLYEREMEFARVLANVHWYGIKIDESLAKKYSYQAECRMQEIARYLGFDPMKPAQLARTLYAKPPGGLGLNPGLMSKRKLSPPVVTSKGLELHTIPVMDKAALTAHQHPKCDAVLEYRMHSKAKSTWFDGFLRFTDDNGRMHPTLKQTGTVTTRLSGEKPNPQQLPRTSEEEQEQGVSKALVKKMILAEEGYEVWEADYSQIELRLAHCYGGDANAREVILSGGDLHQLTADEIGIERYEGKTFNFAILYGAGAAKLAKMCGKPASWGHDKLSAFWGAYPGLAKAVREAERAAERGWVRLWTGRKRHFQYPSEYRKAFNSVMQGGAAEIMKDTMIKLKDKRVIGQVHDALWFELQTPVDEELALIKKVMEWPSEKFPLPFPVDIKRIA